MNSDPLDMFPTMHALRMIGGPFDGMVSVGSRKRELWMPTFKPETQADVMEMSPDRSAVYVLDSAANVSRFDRFETHYNDAD